MGRFFSGLAQAGLNVCTFPNSGSLVWTCYTPPFSFRFLVLFGQCFGLQHPFFQEGLHMEPTQKVLGCHGAVNFGGNPNQRNPSKLNDLHATGKPCLSSIFLRRNPKFMLQATLVFLVSDL